MTNVLRLTREQIFFRFWINGPEIWQAQKQRGGEGGGSRTSPPPNNNLCVHQLGDPNKEQVGRAGIFSAWVETSFFG